MNLREMAESLGPHLRAVASRRWPGEVCTVYAVMLQDPLGHKLAHALRALELAPDPFDRMPAGGNPLVMAGVLPSLDMLTVLWWLEHEDRLSVVDGVSTLAARLSRLRSAVEEAARADATAIVLVGNDRLEVLRLDEEGDEAAAARLFGRAPTVGQA